MNQSNKTTRISPLSFRSGACHSIQGLVALAGVCFCGTLEAGETPSLLGKWGKFGTGNGDFHAPAHMAVNPIDESVYVVDSLNHRIQRIQSNGTWMQTWGRNGGTSGFFITEWGTIGLDDDQFLGPRCVAVDGNGDVYVGDSQHKVGKFDLFGSLILTWGSYGRCDGRCN